MYHDNVKLCDWNPDLICIHTYVILTIRETAVERLCMIE